MKNIMFCWANVLQTCPALKTTSEHFEIRRTRDKIRLTIEVAIRAAIDRNTTIFQYRNETRMKNDSYVFLSAVHTAQCIQFSIQAYAYAAHGNSVY